VQLGTIDRSLPGNQLFGPENIRPTGFELREDTRLTDAYTADLQVFAGFAMVDLAFGPRWRFVGGIRVEDADQTVVTIDPLTTSGKPIVATLRNRDPLPAANIIYALTSRQNLRFGYSRTVSRPDFRELSPFEFTNVAGGFTAIGNPNLLRATIDNYDIRWEYFPTGDQLIAFSYFYKDFANPIESTIEATNALRQSYLNAEGARNQGIEAELRRSLRWLSSALSAFTLGSNFTLVDSSVTIPEDQRNVLTTLERPLVGQSRYIFNGNIEWVNPKWRSQARFFANYISSRITDVGAFRLPDIVQQPNVILDAVYQVSLTEDGKWSMRFSAENLANNEYRFTQGNQPFRNYRVGRTFSIGTSFTIF
jgi:TonB-dependent receptor